LFAVPPPCEAEDPERATAADPVMKSKEPTPKSLKQFCFVGFALKSAVY
jgi:hypothetical protein